MAETKETIIFEVDVSSLTKSISEARVEMDAYSAALAKSTEETGKNSEATIQAKAAYDAQKKSVQQQEGALLRMTQAQKSIGGSLKDVIKNYDASGKSIDQNRKVLNALTAEYVKTINPSKEFTNRIKGISDELKKQESAIGDNRRNVGNYKESILDAVGGLNVFGVSANKIIDPLKNISGGFSNMGASVGSLAVAGLPLLIGAINGAIAILQKFDSVTEGVEDAMSGVNFAFDYFVAHGNETFSGFGDLADNLQKAYEEGAKLSKTIRELNEMMDINSTTNLRNEVEIDRLLIQARDRTKTEQERIALLDEASVKEEDNLKRSQELAKQRKDIAFQELLRVTTAGLNDDKQKKEFQEATRAFLQLEKESIAVQEKIKVRRNQLLEDIKNDALKETEENKKKNEKILQQEKDKNDKLAALKKQHDTDVTNLEIEFGLTERERIEDSFASKQALLNSQIPEELELIRKIEEAKIAALKEFDNKKLKQEEAFLETRGDLRRQADERAAELADNAVREQLNRDNQVINAFVDGILNVFSTVSDFISQNTENSIADMEDQVAAGLMSQEQFDKESRKLRAEAFEKDKALKITQTVINTAASVMNMLATAPWPINLIMAAFATATGIAQAVLIGQQRPPKFAEGGEYIPVGGREHERGGTKYVGEDGNKFEVEKGERIYVLKKTASDKIDYLSMVNQMFGGRAWTDSPIAHAAFGGQITDGGFVARNSSENANSLFLVQSFAKQLIDNMPAPIVSVKEITKVSNSINRSVSVSEL